MTRAPLQSIAHRLARSFGQCGYAAAGATPLAIVTVLANLCVSGTPALADQDWARSQFAAFGSSGATSTSTWSQGFDFGIGRPQAALRAGGRPILSKRGLEPLKKAIKHYSAIAKNGGWKTIPKSVVGMKSGSRGPEVALLRARLEATGDLRSRGLFSSSFDYYVAQALQHFQRRHGLKPTGDLVDKSRRRANGSRTLAALNVPVSSRIRQLKANLNRIRVKARRPGKRYVVVNIPAQIVEAVEDDRVASRHIAVVGKRDRATPRLSSKIHRIKFNPDWTLPPTVIREDLIPKGRRMARGKESVLVKYGIDAYTHHGGRKLDPKRINWFSSAVHGYVYKQDPGPDNPLGFAKIDFHNQYSVYMHDTPSQRVFGRADRAASSGCVRIQGIERLISWILEGNGNWSLGRVMAMKRSGETMNVSLKRQVPVHFVYITSWVDEDGFVQFRRDLYGRDRRYGVSRLAMQ